MDATGANDVGVINRLVPGDYNMWIFFVDPSLPYDEYSSPMFGITYFATAFASAGAACILVITGCLFLCMSTHLSACLMDIVDTIADIDGVIGR